LACKPVIADGDRAKGIRFDLNKVNGLILDGKNADEHLFK
jgi:hypothetical protein